MRPLRAALTIGGLAWLAAMAVGCGGVSGSHSVSPASFFLPGLIYHQPETPDPNGEVPPPVTGPREKPLAS
ncbi:MAG: hypothetical protein KF833_17395 [Verrucomicrobiae bacterium]|nr:hypothetical protein [Verrucomicrobiae bacterium]